MDTPKVHRIHLPEIASTNSYAHALIANEEIVLVTADYQTTGRGQRGNSWESERDKNLLFSLVLPTNGILAAEQFILCELISVALCDVLGRYTSDIRIKWPNDIYYKDKKLCGILIEHDLEGMQLSRSIIGVGLNVNQFDFVSGSPNPISLSQIMGHDVDREVLLTDIISHFLALYKQFITAASVVSRDELHHRYLEFLYRKDTPAQYSDLQGVFTAILRTVERDGHLILEDQWGNLRSFLFKEVHYII